LITSLLLFAALTQGHAVQPSQEVSPGRLISKMMAKYADAKTMVGTIRLTVSAMGQKSHLDTYLQYEKPSKLYLKQVSPLQARPWLVVSDGKHFVFDKPNYLPGSEVERLIEPVVEMQPPKKRGDSPKEIRKTIREIYAASSASLKDRSVPLDIAIGRLEDLQFIRDQWATLYYRGKAEVNGRQVDLISGDWRAYGLAPASGSYELYIAEDGSLVRYVLLGSVAGTDPNSGRATQATDVVSVWDVALNINATPDESVFSVKAKPQG
jgi:hypothetical protein